MVVPSHLTSHISYLDSCASCHSRREQMTDGFKPGDRYHDHFRLTLADNPLTFHPDGQIRDEDYEYNSFMTSRMGHKGVVCTDCHDPHSYKLKLPLENNALCLSCHLAPGQNGAVVIEPLQHGHHALTNAGSACVDCHMPQTTYMQRDPRRDHGFTSPDPQLTKELGIPNACNRCHADQTTDWSIGWMQQWYGDRMEQRRARARARVIARAQRADDAVVPDLVALARSEEIASWRATLLTLLGAWAAQDPVRALLQESLTNEHPLIRSAAVNGLRGQPGAYDRLAPLRRDPVRLVRLDTAWATLNPVEREPASYAELAAYLNHLCDQPAGAIRQGQKALLENQPAAAEAWMRKAADWDPSAVPHFLLGQVLHRNGKSAEAETLFRKAAAYDPTNPEYPYTLALFYGELNRPEDARAQLQKAVELDPGFGRAWYNLGLAHAGQNGLNEAREALLRAETLLAGSPDAPYALATVLARAGDFAGARAAAQRALVIAPGHGPSRQLLASLPP
jgi:predicted CXXCH cytochrome family protein